VPYYDINIFQPVRRQWRVHSAVLYLMMYVQEHDSEDSFFCGDTDTITKDTRTTHGLINRDECNRCTDGEENRDELNRLYEQAQVHVKHFKRLQVFP